MQVDYITLDPLNSLRKEEIKEVGILLIEALIRLFIYLFSSLISIGCKEMARWLSEAEGISGADARENCHSRGREIIILRHLFVW